MVRPNKLGIEDEYQRVVSFIKIKDRRKAGNKVECSVLLIRTLSMEQKRRLDVELTEAGIEVDWIIHGLRDKEEFLPTVRS